jgi:hypothetical protein
MALKTARIIGSGTGRRIRRGANTRNRGDKSSYAQNAEKMHECILSRVSQFPHLAKDDHALPLGSVLMLVVFEDGEQCLDGGNALNHPDEGSIGFSFLSLFSRIHPSIISQGARE